jgi:hypothetical protein
VALRPERHFEIGAGGPDGDQREVVVLVDLDLKLGPAR